MVRRNLFSNTMVASLVIMLSCVPLFSQEHLGGIQGLITDPSGAAVPSAAITAVNKATGLVSTAQTDVTGHYGVPFLVPGTYRISVQATGFATAVNEEVVLSAAETLRVDISLVVGDLKQEITVTSEAPLLQTGSTTLQATVTGKTILELPLVNQNPSAVVMLLPGMALNNNGVSGQTGGFLVGTTASGPLTPSANGIRDTASVYTADGSNINAGLYNFLSANPAQDAVQEVTVQTGNYSAEYGVFAGVHVNFVLKSGTNSIHGSVWEFMERTKLNARNAFAATRSPLNQDQFGGSAGGPIIKNKTFIFGSYQGFRSSTSQHVAHTVLTTEQRTGDLSLDVNGNPIPVFNDPLTGLPFPLVNGKANQIPLNRIHPTTAAAIDILEPLPNASGPANWQQELTLPQPSNQYTVKVDHAIGDNDRFSARYWQTKAELWLGGWYAGEISTNWVPVNTWCFGLNETHTFSPTMVLSTRGSFNRNTEAEYYTNFPNTIDTRALFKMDLPSNVGPGNQLNIYPYFAVTGLTPIGTAGNVPLASQPDENWEIASTLEQIKGKHAVKLGFEYYRFRSGRTVNNNTNGHMSFGAGNPNGSGNALADFLLGLPSSSNVALDPIVQDMRHTVASFFIADKWRATPKLTFDIGLRYEMMLPLSETRGRIPSFSFDAPGAYDYKAGGEGLWQVGMRQWAPRVGLTYQLTPNNLIRAGGGIFYGYPALLVMTFKGSNPPFATSYNFTSSPGLVLTADQAFPIGSQIAGGVVAPNTYQTDVNMPQAQLWTFNIQHSFSPTLMVDVGYVGTHGIRFGRSITRNTPLTPGTPCPLAGPTPGCTPKGGFQARRPLPNWGSAAHFQFDGNSTYHALQVGLTKRTSYGLSMLANYTYSKTLDQGAGDLYGFTLDPLNLNNQNGPSDMDQKHLLRMAWVYQLPWGRGKQFNIQSRAADLVVGGWQLSGVLSYRAGFPITVGYSDSSINNMGLGQRPNRVCDGKKSDQDITSWFDASCFVSPIPENMQGIVDYGYIGNSGHGVLYGPSMTVWDLNLSKSFTTYESQYFQVRFEAYNAFNHVNYNQPSASVGPGVTSTGRIFGAGKSRFMAIGFKYYF